MRGWPAISPGPGRQAVSTLEGAETRSGGLGCEGSCAVWVDGQAVGAAAVRGTVGCVGLGVLPLDCPGRPQGEEAPTSGRCLGGGGLVAKSCPPLVTPGYSFWDFPGKNTGVGCHFLLQGIVPTQESNQALLHCRRILYQLSFEGGDLQSICRLGPCVLFIQTPR